MALVVALPAVFLIYLMACLSDLHGLLKPVQLTFWTATVTASLETLRFAAICSLPAVAAFALRFYLLDHASRGRTADGQPPRLAMGERLMATAAGAVTSAILPASSRSSGPRSCRRPRRISSSCSSAARPAFSSTSSSRP